MTRLTINNGINLASHKGGLCLEAGKSSRDKWLWQCSCGNIWSATYSVIRGGSWCPRCSKNIIHRLADHAKKHNGKVLSDNCTNIFTKVSWQCCEGHIWEAIPSNILHHNRWCPYCSKNKKLDINYASEIATKRGGELLSESYANSGSKLKWKCKAGHIFEMSINSVNSRGSWCPYCKSWNCEEICRKFFEETFGCKFYRIRPWWLVNGKGNKLELDGYSDSKINGYNIAFEHNGLQHYVDNYLPTDLDTIKKHDLVKTENCIKNGTLLFVIPHLFRITKIDDLPKLIERTAEEYGLKVVVPKVDFSDVYLLSNKMSKYKDLILKRGGRLVTDSYFSSSQKIEIICEFGHSFYSTPNRIQSGGWCSHCSHNSKLCIDDMKDLAKDRGGICLSELYKNARTKMLWQCSENHQWLAVPHSVKSGSWCPICSRNRMEG